jgi:NADH:ubiquinone oxidoreductase subunit 5 (subunit L)/multisubunit Na+/H+ antiporter MnhA subunit
VLTALYGILNASVHRDYKRLLAYCTIENVGIAGIGIGTGLIGRGTGSELMMLLGYGGALLHVLNHSLYKSLLFYASGSVYLATHTLNMEHLGGIIKKMPHTSVLFLIGAFAITGLPPFNGFVSEFLIYSGLAYGIQINSVKDTMLFILAFAGMALTGGIAILAFTRAFSTIFLGMPRTTAAENVKETDWQQLAPLYVIVLIMILIACYPYLYFPALTKAIAILASSAQIHPEWEVYPQILSSVSIFSLVFAGIVAVVWFVRSRLIKTADIRVEPTWGCGYTKMSPKLQYTGKSFSKPLAKIFSFILLENKSYTEIEAGELFPGNRNYKSHYSDFWEQFLIQPLVNRMDKWTNLLGFIHNGRIQSYVLYGIVFMLIMLIITFANLAP